MATLRLYLPESWPDGAGREPLAWALCDGPGTAAQHGRALPAQLPPAERLELVAPAAAVLLTSATLPPRRGDKARRLLPYAVEDRLAVDPDSVHVAMGPATADGAVALAVVDKAWLDQTLAMLAEAGLRPRRMVPETLLPERDGATWTVVWQGAGGFVRSGACAGLALDGAAGVPVALAATLQEAGVAGKLPDRIAVRCAPGTAAPDCMQWTMALGLPVSHGPDWDWRRADLAVAPLDLLQGDYVPRTFAPDLLPRFKPALAILGLILALQGLGTLADWWRLKREKRQLLAHMEASFRQAFPEASAVVDPALQMERQLAALRRAAGRPQAGDFLPLLAQVAPLLESAGDGRVRAIGYEGGALTLGMTLAGSEAAARLQRRFADAGARADVAASPATAAGVPVRVTIRAD